MFLRDNANKENFEGNIVEMFVPKKLNLARDEAHAAAAKKVLRLRTSRSSRILYRDRLKSMHQVA